MHRRLTQRYVRDSEGLWREASVQIQSCGHSGSAVCGICATIFCGEKEKDVTRRLQGSITREPPVVLETNAYC